MRHFRNLSFTVPRHSTLSRAAVRLSGMIVSAGALKAFPSGGILDDEIVLPLDLSAHALLDPKNLRLVLIQINLAPRPARECQLRDGSAAAASGCPAIDLMQRHALPARLRVR